MKITKPVIDLCIYYTLADNEADKEEEERQKISVGKDEYFSRVLYLSSKDGFNNISHLTSSFTMWPVNEQVIKREKSQRNFRLMKSCSNSLVIRIKQIKMIMNYHIVLIRLALREKLLIISCGAVCIKKPSWEMGGWCIQSVC